MKTLVLFLLTIAPFCSCNAQPLSSVYDTARYKHLIVQSKNYKIGAVSLILFVTGVFCAGVASWEILFQPKGHSNETAYILMGAGSVVSLFSVPFFMHANMLKRDARVMLTPGLSSFNTPHHPVGIGMSATVTIGRKSAAR